MYNYFSMKLFFIALSFFSAFFTSNFALAANPSVSSFLVSPASTNPGYPVAFSWTIQNAGGYSFIIYCQPGIKLKDGYGNSFPCDTLISSTSNVNDYKTIAISNVSGTAKTIQARIIPKDVNGQDYSSGAQDTYVSVATHSKPITDFSSDVAIATSGKPITLSWSSIATEGVNISAECNNNIRATSSSYSSPSGFMPCGEPIFSSNLSSSGSLSLNLINYTKETLPYRLTLLPAISTSTYDGTHAAYLDVKVSPGILPDPVVSYFAASSTMANSGENIKLTWTTENTIGANLIINCVAMVTSTSSIDLTSTSTLPCGAPAFTSAVATSGTMSLAFKNSNNNTQTVFLSLVPSKKSGEYDATRGKQISLLVRPYVPPPQASSSSISSSLNASSSPSSSSSQISSTYSSSSSTASLKVNKNIFTKMLKRGSVGQEVSSLQEFLKKDIAVYPEGAVSGYFGPATFRAVVRFQKKYKITSENDPALGMVGPKTRAKLNELQ